MLACILRDTAAVGITLNKKNLGLLYGNHIRRMTRNRSVVTVFTEGAYVLNKKVCYADNQEITDSYLETIYT